MTLDFKLIPKLSISYYVEKLLLKHHDCQYGNTLTFLLDLSLAFDTKQLFVQF